MVSDFKLVILSYNHPVLTKKAVESALAHVSSSQILLFHNGSQPEHFKKLQNEFPQIQHAALEQNKGFSGGANAALREAFKTHSWVFFMTNDCELNKITKPPEDAFLSAPLIYNKKREKIDSLGGVLNIKKAKLSHCKNQDEFKTSKNIYPYIPGTAFWIHKNIFETLNGFDESFHTYWEDVDFSLRAQRQGLKISTDQTTQLTHKIGKTCHKDSFYTSYLFQRNRIRVSKKYGSKFNLQLYGELSLQVAKHIKAGRWKNLNYLLKAMGFIKDYHQ